MRAPLPFARSTSHGEVGCSLLPFLSRVSVAFAVGQFSTVWDSPTQHRVFSIPGPWPPSVSLWDQSIPPCISKSHLEEVVPHLAENVTKKECKKQALGFGSGWWH